CGYGGSCFSKDISALIRMGTKFDFDPSLLRAGDERKQRPKEVVLGKIRAHFGSDICGRRFGLWGLGVQPETNDVREATSIMLISRLVEAGATVCAFDPIAMDEAAAMLDPAWIEDGRVRMSKHQYHALEDADAMILVTEWKRFRQPDFIAMKDLL